MELSVLLPVQKTPIVGLNAGYISELAALRAARNSVNGDSRLVRFWEPSYKSLLIG